MRVLAKVALQRHSARTTSGRALLERQCALTKRWAGAVHCLTVLGPTSSALKARANGSLLTFRTPCTNALYECAQRQNQTPSETPPHAAGEVPRDSCGSSLNS